MATADLATLKSIPGICDAVAQKIISHRDTDVLTLDGVLQLAGVNEGNIRQAIEDGSLKLDFPITVDMLTKRAAQESDSQELREMRMDLVGIHKK